MLPLFYYALLCVYISFAIIMKKAGCFPIIALQMYCYNTCCVALPRGAVGWSAVVVVVFS